jgi:hypothetical protein
MVTRLNRWARSTSTAARFALFMLVAMATARGVIWTFEVDRDRMRVGTEAVSMARGYAVNWRD